ncbi:hypothetical protein ['Catharanthus roseus' aster yellows phytoplasma]|uniref:Uncharacterized protein n=1 Tax='Catharanthus roseus' aster yellows phytoplasma TaxID=1193712 RepID=A0A4P6M9W4_9MOLU|nr:hypothetical protein ['Catharanthus roseus' aster yellows phytoplasma]QBF23777.1 hypothetical protein EXT02_00900 ['Catharanthus roseus' aster yellows phytoplasma]
MFDIVLDFFKKPTISCNSSFSSLLPATSLKVMGWYPAVFIFHFAILVSFIWRNKLPPII